MGEDDADNAPLSKTKRKAAMDELQHIGETLITLSKDQLAKLELPEKLLQAVTDAKKITANGAIRRQRQYIGSLMREIDVAPIVDQLQRWQGKHTAENAHFHQLERLRQQLLSEPNALSEFIARYPQVDSQQIRTLIRNSQRELSANKPPKSSRELFRVIREVVEANQAGTGEPETSSAPGPD